MDTEARTHGGIDTVAQAVPSHQRSCVPHVRRVCHLHRKASVLEEHGGCHGGVGDRMQRAPQSASVIRKTAFGIGAVGVGAIENSAPIAAGHARLLRALNGVLPLDFVEVWICLAQAR